MTVGAAFDNERPSLMAMPPNPHPLEERVEVHSGIILYAFRSERLLDPHTHVRCSFTVLASAHRVRILDGKLF
ncbi:MAG: hypothetical protein IPO19_22570 [Rhodoferax sp.]|nr:hypothetical protein [Rhodoferax sp.]